MKNISKMGRHILNSRSLNCYGKRSTLEVTKEELIMIKKARVEARVDKKLKEEVLSVLRKLDISESEAIRMYFRQIALTQGIPFEVKIPNKETIKALNEVKNGKLREYNNFDDYLADIGIK